MDYRFQCGQLGYGMKRLRVPRRNLDIYSELLVVRCHHGLFKIKRKLDIE
jgi:hypothetical protein